MHLSATIYGLQKKWGLIWPNARPLKKVDMQYTLNTDKSFNWLPRAWL